MESEGRLCPAHRHRPEQPTPQGVGAFAAIERDDRAAITERDPHRLLDNRGNKRRRRVQARSVAFHTPRTEGSALPRITGWVARVTANHRELVHTLLQLARGGAVPGAQSDIVVRHFPNRGRTVTLV